MKGRFTSEVVVEHPLEDVFAWHERRGALTRLCPPWNSSVVAEPSDGIRTGSTATLHLDLPGTFGAAGVKWVAEHVDYDPPHRFSDVMASGPLRSWHHDHRFAATSDGSGTKLTDAISYSTRFPVAAGQRGLIDRMLRRNFAFRARQLGDDLDFHAGHAGPRLRIAISGASGLIGAQLCALLSTGGHDVLRLVRRLAVTEDEITWDPCNGKIDREALRATDVVIHLAGEPIGGRFTASNKSAILESRVHSTTLLAETLAELVGGGGPSTFVCASAIGFYGADRGQELLDETSDGGGGFLAEVCRSWEAATTVASQAGIRVVNVRTGVVQTPSGGALAKVLPLFRCGVGGRLGSGTQWLSWISIDDIVGLFAHAALTPTVSGPLDGVAPLPVTAAEYAKVLGRVLHRPSFLPVPSFGPKLLLGGEGAEELALASQRVDATKAVASGYEFRHPTLEVALRHVLGR